MRKSRSGFTIVELLIVVVVIAILAAISMVAYTNIQQRARDSARLNDVGAIKKLLALYKVDNGRYPTEIPNPGSSTYEISSDAGFLSSLSNYTSVTFKTPNQTSSAGNAYWYRTFVAGSGCPVGIGPYAILWVRGMENQTSGIIKNQCSGSTLHTGTPNVDSYVEYLY